LQVFQQLLHLGIALHDIAVQAFRQDFVEAHAHTLQIAKFDLNEAIGTINGRVEGVTAKQLSEDNPDHKDVFPLVIVLVSDTAG